MRSRTNRATRLVLVVLFALAFAVVASAKDAADLAIDQSALAAKFNRLEALALRIAELVEPDDAERAQQLRDAVRRSREQAVADRFDTIVGLLESERLAAAGRNQEQLAEQLGDLMRLLLADPREARAEAERKRLKKLLKDLGRLIKAQQSLRNALFDGQDGKRIVERQRQLADDVKEASGGLGESGSPAKAPPQNNAKQSDKGSKQPAGKDSPGESNPSGESEAGEAGEPSEGQPPNEQSNRPLNRAQRRLAEARQAMQQAVEALEDAKDREAQQGQAEAQQRLEDARREIEEALKQLREEEQVRMLTRLATRFRRMLAEQTSINELTKSTAAAAPTPVDRTTRLAAAGLAEREQALVRLADSALRLLNEDAQSIAFPEVVEQLRSDMRQVASWLSEVQLGAATQEVEQDIVEQLEEAIAAFEQGAAEKQQQQAQGSQQPSAGQQQAELLAGLIAELRMVRSLQARLLRRTARWDRLLSAGQASPEQARAALQGLAKKQARLAKAAETLHKDAEQL